MILVLLTPGTGSAASLLQPPPFFFLHKREILTTVLGYFVSVPGTGIQLSPASDGLIPKGGGVICYGTRSCKPERPARVPPTSASGPL